jgi:hypothetical protein
VTAIPQKKDIKKKKKKGLSIRKHSNSLKEKLKTPQVTPSKHQIPNSSKHQLETPDSLSKTPSQNPRGVMISAENKCR